jgi:excisionase family DNA binding protein
VTRGTQGSGATHGDLPAYLTPREVAAVLRRSVKSLYRLIRADASFPRVKLHGDGYLIPRAGLERWLTDRTEGMRTPVRLTVITATSAPPCAESAAPCADIRAGALNGTAEGGR